MTSDGAPCKIRFWKRFYRFDRIQRNNVEEMQFLEKYTNRPRSTDLFRGAQ